MDSPGAPQVLHHASEAAAEIFKRLGQHVRIATPLGLGKPNELLNLLYARVKDDPCLQLTLYTALSLNPPEPKPELARRLFGPFSLRQWGTDYPTLRYAKDGARDYLPSNVKIHEFYFQAGTALASESLQRAYQSINYTHVAESLLQADVQVLVQLIARGSQQGNVCYSLSCNPDVTLDVVDLYARHAKPLLRIGVIHPDLPFLGGEAAVAPKFFDIIVDDSTTRHELFALPRLPVTDTDHAIGLYASQLVTDGGTLQLGIGALSDAVVESLLLRHRDNALYSQLVAASRTGGDSTPPSGLDTGPFVHGLYGLSELVSDGFMHLRMAGILKRQIIDEKSGTRTYLHGAFYLGSKDFYQWVRTLSGDDFTGMRLTRVSRVNDLYDPNELALRAQRKHPRFLNTCMQVTLLGGAASDTLEDGRVISGVGGQYNFVSMAHELQDSRSILMLRSTRTEGGRRCSNIVWSHGHLTIPRHLRDIVVTEYGIADIRGKSDEETICALLAITDSEFQPALAKIAKKNGKLAKDYEIPAGARLNRPGKVRQLLSAARQKSIFGPFPLGSDFTPVEERIVVALERLQTAGKLRLALMGIFALDLDPGLFKEELQRMKLDSPHGLKERFLRSLLVSALSAVALDRQLD